MTPAPLYNEPQLLAQVSEGDETAFAALYRHYYPQLKPLIWKYTGSESDTEEILQETFLKVWLNRDRLTDVVHFRAWLFRVASRQHLMAVRKRLLYDQKLDVLGKHSQDISPVSPYESAHLQELRRLVNEVVERMPEQRRKIYELSRSHGLRTDEIAERLSIAPRTVKNVLTIALKEIRDRLVASGHGPLLIIYGLMLFNLR